MDDEILTWDEARAREAIASIVADAEAALDGYVWPTHPLDDPVSPADQIALYCGTAGMIWALGRLGSSLDLDALATAALEHYPPDAPDEERLSLYGGLPGILLLTRSDDQQLRELVRANERSPAWEVLYGSPGTILAAQAAGLDDEAQRSVDILLEEWERHDWGLWDCVLSGHAFQSIGPAHGFVGNIHVLRAYLDEDLLRTRTERILREYAVWDGDAVNWPPGPGHPLDRIQWCHGAPGIVATVGDLTVVVEQIAFRDAVVWKEDAIRRAELHLMCHNTSRIGNRGSTSMHACANSAAPMSPVISE